VRSRRRLAVLVIALLAVFAAAIVSASAAVFDDAPPQLPVSTVGSSTTPVVSAAVGGNYAGLRPTSVGLPQIGQSGTFYGGTLTSALNAYVSSGQYESDLSAVAGAATTYLNQRLSEATMAATRICHFTYRRVHVKHVSVTLYRRGKACVLDAPPRFSGKPAVVLDIDETSLSNLSGLQDSGYTEAGLLPAALGNLPAIAPTLAFYRDAVAHHVSVFFVTGRAGDLESITASNLTAAGYNAGYAALDLNTAGAPVEQYKSSTRAAIEKMGYDIIANLGDQESDLDGGYADQGFKLPNPFYFIADN
jgi:predicted secreted acid phosphatase